MGLGHSAQVVWEYRAAYDDEIGDSHMAPWCTLEEAEMTASLMLRNPDAKTVRIERHPRPWPVEVVRVVTEAQR